MLWRCILRLLKSCVSGSGAVDVGELEFAERGVVSGHEGSEPPDSFVLQLNALYLAHKLQCQLSAKLVLLVALAIRCMPTKASSAGAQQTLSSFFKPATPSQKRPPPDEVLILDSDDDDDLGTAPASAGARTLAGTSKKVKLEHDTRATQLSPIASTSKLPLVAAATASSTSQAKAPSASAKRIRDFAYLEGRERAPRTTPSDADKARHDAFVKRLSLGPNLLQKRSSYLQKEHHLAAAEQDTDGVLDRRHGAAAGMSSTNTEDLEEEEDEEEDSPSIGTSRSKGKGKAKEVAPSRLAKFAAKGKSTATSPGGDSVKYTPLEQQVLALRKANPGVLLIVEVRSEPGPHSIAPMLTTRLRRACRSDTSSASSTKMPESPLGSSTSPAFRSSTCSPRRSPRTA